MKEEDVVRARFLMSPYNIREVRRAKEVRNVLIGIGLTVVVIAVIAGLMGFLYR